MAEETTDDKYFSSLDPLGPSFGGINRPTLDVKGFSPFEGDRPLSLPEINFPIVPVQPSVSSLTSRQNFVRENVVGSPSRKAPTKATTPDDLLTAIVAKDRAVAYANQDQNEYAKIFAYDSGPAGGNFYKRYAAFGDETFHKLGFHPLLNNEAMYNENTTGWQQTKRMLTHSFWPLLKLGFGSGWESTVKMFKGDFSANTDDAKAFEEAAAIGYNSRGGIGAGLSNAFLNFGYTAGIIAEAAVEEAVALGIEAVTVGGATPAVVAATANNARKVFNAFKGLEKIDDVADAMKAVNSSVKAMNNVSNARRFFDAAKVKKAAGSLGRFFNPLENTYDAVRGIIKNEDNLTGLARMANATRRGFGGFYGDIKAVNMALSEARLEAGIQQNHMYDDLYNDHYKKFGVAPNDEQQKAMIKTAKDAGTSSLVWNTGLIFASNKIVLDNWVGGKGRGPLSYMRNKTEELLNLEGGKVIKTRGAKTLSTGKQFKTTNLQWRKNNLWNTVKAFKDQPLRKSAAGAIGYFKRNITEALQENAQEVISEATKDYYIEAYSHPNTTAHIDARGLTMQAIGEQFSKKGFETFASGFAMGMFSAPLNALKPALTIGYNKIFNKEEFVKNKTARDTAGENFVKYMSSIPIEEFFDNNVFDYGSQSGANDIRMSGTEKDARDASDAAFIFKMGSVMQNNMTDLYREQLQNLTELNAQEIEEVIPSIPKGEGQKYLDKLPAIIEKMNKVENRYKAVNERFPNPINLSDLDKDAADYEDAVLLHKAWEIGKRNAVFMSESFDDSMSRMSSLMNDLISNGPIRKGSYNNIKVLFEQNVLKNELDMLTTQIESLEGVKGSEEELRKAKKKKDALEKVNASLSKFRNHFDSSERARIKETIIEKNPGLPVEEINRVVDEELGIRSEETDSERLAEFKSAYSEYIKTIGNIEGESVFDSAIDDSFEKLKDYYLLSSESKRLAEYVNILHDPKGFYEHIQKNKAWMKELYDNRAEYYENLKEQEFQKRETNDLLNHLASRNLYISFDELEKWLTAGILPEEIFDDTNKTVIKKSNPMYNDIIQPFLMLKQVQSKKSEAEIIKDSVKNQLDELEQKKAERIKALPVEEKRVEVGPIPIKRSAGYKKIAKEMQDGDYVTAITNQNEEFTFYKDGEDLKYENKEGEIVTDDNLGKQKFVSANVFRIVSEPDPVEVQKINDEFEAIKSEIIARAVDKGVEDPESVEPTIYTTDTPMDKFPKDLFNDLSVAFAKQYTEENGEMNLSPDDFFPALEAFIKSDFLAARIIDDYNKEQEIKRGTEVDTTEAPDIKIVINNTPVSLDELDETDIRGFLRTFEAELKSLQEKPDRTPEENTQLSKLKYNVNGIKKFLQQQVRAGFSAEQKKTIDVLEKLIKEQGNILKSPGGYVINGKVMQRVTNVIKEFLPEYSYRDETAVRATFATTIGEQGFTVDSIKNFISELRKQKLGGFSEFTYTELEKDLNAMLADPTMISAPTQKAAVSEPEIFQPTKAEIKKDGNVVYGAAGKMKESPDRINQDALFVDNAKGLFIVADGMGGVDRVPFFRPHHAAQLMIDHFKGIDGKTPINIIEDLYKANKNITTEEIFAALQNENYIDKNQKYDNDAITAIAIRAYLEIISNPNDYKVLDKNRWVTNGVGAVGVKAQRVAENKYEIEHVGDAVFFIADEKGNVRQAEGLSTSPYVDGFIWGIDVEGKTGAQPAKQISKFTVELKPGERLVLSSDFIETESAIKDFIDSNFGENLDFDGFRRKNKNDDASFIVINYTTEPVQTQTTTQPSTGTQGLQIATDLSPAAKAKLKTLGFSEEMQSRMSKADLEIAKTLTSKEDAKELIDKYTQAQGMSNEQILSQILNLVSEKTYQASKDAGNYMDDQIRNLLDNVDPVFDETKITQKAFDEAFRADEENPGYVRRIKDIIDKEGLYIVSRVRLEDGGERGFVVYDEDAGIAGEIDLLAVDRFGKLHIIDVKTGRSSKWAGFNNIEKGYSKKDNYTLQQLAYSNLLYNMTNMNSTISLLPIQLEYDDETSIISKVERPSAKDLLKPGTYRINLTPTEQIKANIESKIPRKVEVVETAVTEPANIIGEDFEVEVEEEMMPEPPAQQGAPIEKLKSALKDAPQELLDSIKSELSRGIANNLFTAADIIAIQEVIDQRQRELDSGGPVKLTANNVKTGDALIANQTIFTGKNDSEIFASEGDDVVIGKVDPNNNKVTLKSLSNGKQKPVSFEELNKMFILKQTVMAFEEEETDQAPLTKVEKSFVNDSIDNVNELLRDNERKEALRKEAALETMDDIDTELFEDTTSDC